VAVCSRGSRAALSPDLVYECLSLVAGRGPLRLDGLYPPSAAASPAPAAAAAAHALSLLRSMLQPARPLLERMMHAAPGPALLSWIDVYQPPAALRAQVGFMGTRSFSAFFK
jgi:hypothetical protein